MEGCLQEMKARCLAPGFCLAHADGDEGPFIYLGLSSQAAPAVRTSAGPRQLGLAFQALISSLLRGRESAYRPTYLTEAPRPAPSWGQQGWEGAEAAKSGYGRSSGLDSSYLVGGALCSFSIYRFGKQVAK